MPTSSANRLAGQSSLYLRQHASNPVDWYPWGSEALDLARRLDRPILLSVGYSSCHWCHVMAHECFEEASIAALMNELFVCIKVDREERPDVDQLYMKALQAMTGRGGWPMTVFLLPDGRPFYAGTYFPPQRRGQMPGFPDVLRGVAGAYADQRSEVVHSAERVAAFLARDERSASGNLPAEEDLGVAADGLVRMMDSEHGGFGVAPKFPSTMALTLLLDVEATRPDPKRRALLRLSLDGMASGGTRDHLGGGFHRYSTDRTWLVPHFEKMLYDQALIAALFLDAAVFFAEPDDAEVASTTFDYVLREMTSVAGGFHATQDADTEGEEGRFFVWTPSEIEAVLGPKQGALFCAAYGVTADGNFDGRNVLHRALSPVELGRRYGEHALGELAACRETLRTARALRPAPARDDKILTDWNGLMMSAVARGTRLLERPDLLAAGFAAADFVRRWMDGTAGLHHVFADGRATVSAFLDDHAMFGRGCLDLFEVGGRREDFESALLSARRLLERFRHPSGRGLLFRAQDDGEPLLRSGRELYDGAVPSGNSMAAELFLRLWALTGEDVFREAGEGILQCFAAEVLASPYGGAHLLSVAERHRRGWITVVVVGERSGRERLVRAGASVGDARCRIFSLETTDVDWMPEALAGKVALPGKALAYLCEGTTCGPPLDDPEELTARLQVGRTGG